MPPKPQIQAVAFISPQNYPILIRTFLQSKDDDLKYHYIAHTSLDVVEERVASASNDKNMDCYLGLLYVMEDYVVYGYITSMKVRIILTLALTDDIFRDAELIAMFRAFHSAYAQSLANPFLRLKASQEIIADHSSLLVHKGQKWRKFERLIDEVSRKAGTIFPETGR